MADYKPSSYFAFFDKLEVVHKSIGIRKKFMDFWNKNSDAIKTKLGLNNISDTVICFSATTGNTAISKKNIEEEYDNFVLGIFDEDTGEWTVYSLDNVKLWNSLADKDRLNINTGNVEDFVLKKISL